MKRESRSALSDCIEEIVTREAEVPGCTPFYETGKNLTGTSAFLITISEKYSRPYCKVEV